MVPPLSALSLALCHEVLEGGGYQQIHKKKLPQCKNGGFHGMEPDIENRHVAKTNFPSCSLHLQFTASQKPPLLFPNAKTSETI